MTFHRISDDHTRVTLQLEYEPSTWIESPGDLLGYLERRVDGNLQGFKKFIEERETATGSWRGHIPAPGVTAT